MKNYVRPSIEVSKFSVEDIITASGVFNDTLSTEANDVYTTYLNGADAAANVVEFQW